MEIYGTVLPMVMTREGYAFRYGDDDPGELDILQAQDEGLARHIAEVLEDLYFLQTTLTLPRDEEGLEELVGTEEELHALRVIAAELHGRTPEEYQEGRVPAGFQFNHLINHADTDGYYLPVDFPQAFFLDEISIGSAVALLAELQALEPVLAERFPADVALARATSDDDERAEISGPVGVWHSLCRLCRSAVALDMPIIFGEG